MSKRTHALVVAAMVAALNLAGMTAIAHAQANDQPTSDQNARRSPTQAQVGKYRYYHDALAAQGQADAAAQRKLSENWTYYYHATQMSPAQLKAWMQAKDHADTPTKPPTQVPAPVPPTEPNGQPTWLVVSLGGLAAALAVVAGLALLAARRATRRAQVGHAT